MQKALFDVSSWKNKYKLQELRSPPKPHDDKMVSSFEVSSSAYDALRSGGFITLPYFARLYTMDCEQYWMSAKSYSAVT